MPTTKTDAERMAELQAALDVLKAKASDERAEVLAPVVETILPHVTFADSANGKPWHGAVINAQVTTSDGRKVRVSITLTDVEATARLKKAAATTTA